MATKIDIGICTYRRSTLVTTLESIARQILPPETHVRVIVADNDLIPSSESIVRDAEKTLKLDILYVHAPAKNISIARNACLDHARAEWLAFIDDDEIADPNWLASLLAKSNQFDIVFGVSRAQYSPTAAKIFRKLDLHSADLSKEREIKTGYSGNVLIRLNSIRAHAIRFDLRLGQAGGEDTVFFYQARLAGLTLGFAPASIVQEPVPAQRENWTWLMKRQFRSGQSHGYCLATLDGKPRLSIFVLAICKFIALAILAFVRIFDLDAARYSWWRAVLHLGVASFAIRPKFLTLYGN